MFVVSDSFQSVAQFFTGSVDERSDALVLEREEFEPTVFQLCADNEKVNVHLFTLCFKCEPWKPAKIKYETELHNHYVCRL